MSIGCEQLLSFSPSAYLPSSASSTIKFKYSTVRHGMFTNSRLHHLQCYKQTQNITHWLASTVVPFQCLFIVRQDTAELFESRHRGVRQEVRLPWQWLYIKWTLLLLSVLWLGGCKVAQKSTGWIRAPRKSKKGVSSMLQVVQWAFSNSLYGRRCFIQAWRRKQPELYTWTKEAGAQIQDVRSRSQTFSSKRDERSGIGAILLPSSPGTPGPGHSRTGTAPATSTDIQPRLFSVSTVNHLLEMICWNIQGNPGVIKRSNIVI